MSGTLLERLQQKVDAELEQYRSGLLSQGAQAVMDNAYELVIKSELAVLLESAFLSKQQVRALLSPLVICCAIPSTRRATMPTEKD